MRVPRYRTGPGKTIEYLGQPLPNLTAHTAFEYMLRCIPALHDVPQIQDEEYRENLAAAAVILRQFEEMDQEQDSGEDKDTGRPAAPGDAVSSAHLGTRESSQSSDHGVNFLDIAKAILRTTTTSGSNGLTDAVGWLALRQEIYYAFSLGRSPQISLPREQEREASPVNRVILHTYQVAKWNYGDKTVQEWGEYTTSIYLLITWVQVPLPSETADGVEIQKGLRPRKMHCRRNAAATSPQSSSARPTNQGARYFH